jgi:hypothetical protein
MILVPLRPWAMIALIEDVQAQMAQVLAKTAVKFDRPLHYFLVEEIVTIAYLLG